MAHGEQLSCKYRRGPANQAQKLSIAAVLLLTACSLAQLTVLASTARAKHEQQSATSSLKELSLEQLGNVEVTSASKEPEEVWQTPSAIYVMTQEDIRRSGATTLPELLRLVPGVEVARIDSNHWSVGVRGFGSQFSRSVLVLIDGRSVYTPLFAGVYWDVQDTLLQDIDQIEVIRGPGGTIWGANAVNAVINIITRRTQDTLGTLVTAGGGNVDQGLAGFRYGGGNGAEFNYRFYGKGFTRGPEYHADGHQFDDWRAARGGFRTDWESRHGDSLTIEGDAYIGADGERVAIASFSPPAQLSIEGNDQVAGGNLSGRWRRQLSGRSDLRLQVYYDRTSRGAPHYKETRNTFDVDFLHHIKTGERNDVLWGVGGRWSPSDFVQRVPTLDFLPHQQTDTIYSGFFQDTFQLVADKLSLTAGTKLEHNNFSGFEYQPTIRTLWRIGAHQSLWAAVTRAMRTPSRLDTDLNLKGFLLNNPPPIYLEIAGNPRYASERLIGYEAGYRTLVTPRLYVDVAWFHNKYDNLSSYGNAVTTIETTPITYILLTFPYQNGVKATTDGFEISPDWKISDWWELKGYYAYLTLSAENQPGNSDTSAVATYEGTSPHHQAVVQSQFNLPKNFEFDQTYRYVSALPAQPVDAYSTMDARFGWRSPWHFEVSVAGQNLFQPFHNEFGISPGPEVGIRRSVYASMTWSY